MKGEYLIIVSLILAILTIGAVSASEDIALENVTATDDGASIDEVTLQEVGTDELIGNDDYVIEDFDALQTKIQQAGEGSEIELDRDYEYNSGFTVDGIVIDKNIIIDGKGHKIDAKGQSRIFNISGNGAVTRIVLKNITFLNGKSQQGGAIHSTVAIQISDCNFVNNNATYYFGGGAIYSEGNSLISDCAFENNSAEQYGGAIYSKGLECNISNCRFVNDTSKWGGAIHYTAAGNFTVQDSSFVNCYALNSGGAFSCRDGVCVIASGCSFINCSSGTADGGAVYSRMLDNKFSNCSFEGNFAKKGKGGAIALVEDSKNCVVTGCLFVNNTSILSYGCAIYCYKSNCAVYNSSFINHTGPINGGGGTIRLSGRQNSGVIFNCSFIGNSGLNGAAISTEDVNCNVSKCIFVNNTSDKAIIYYQPSSGYKLTVNNNIFLNNNGKAIGFSSSDSVSNTDYNWFGHNASNYDVNPELPNCKIWLFLNATANPDTLAISGLSHITFKLYGYDSVSGNILEYDNGLLKPINLTIAATNGDADDTAGLGDQIEYTATSGGTGSVTATVENAACTINLKIKIDPNLVVNPSEIYFCDDAFISIDYNHTAKGKVNVTLRGKNANYTIVDRDISYSISLGRILPGEYNVTVAYSGDDNFVNASANSTLKVKPAVTRISSKNVEIIYGSDSYLVATLEDYLSNPIAGAIIAVSLNGIENYTTDENGTIKVPLKGVDAGNYTAELAFNGNYLYEASDKTVEITINRANSTIVLDNVELDWGSSTNVAVMTEGATGITAKIGNESAAVNNYTIVIPLLAVGNYTLTVATIPDANHLAVNKTVTITVNKLKTQLTANAVTATYNVNRNLVVTLKDSNGNALSGVKLTLNLNGVKTYATDKNGQIKVNVAKLVPKTYTAKVTFAGDDNRTGSSVNVKVTVKKAKLTIVAKKKTFKRTKKVKKYDITLKSGKNTIKKVKVTLKVKGKTYSAKTNNKGKAVFKIKNLKKKGTYKAKITFKGNKYYNKATKTVKIKIK